MTEQLLQNENFSPVLAENGVCHDMACTFKNLTKSCTFRSSYTLDTSDKTQNLFQVLFFDLPCLHSLFFIWSRVVIICFDF